MYAIPNDHDDDEKNVLFTHMVLLINKFLLVSRLLKSLWVGCSRALNSH